MWYSSPLTGEESGCLKQEKRKRNSKNRVKRGDWTYEYAGGKVLEAFDYRSSLTSLFTSHYDSRCTVSGRKAARKIL